MNDTRATMNNSSFSSFPISSFCTTTNFFTTYTITYAHSQSSALFLLVKGFFVFSPSSLPLLSSIFTIICFKVVFVVHYLGFLLVRNLGMGCLMFWWWSSNNVWSCDVYVLLSDGKLWSEVWTLIAIEEEHGMVANLPL